MDFSLFEPLKGRVTLDFSIMIHDGGLSYEISKDFKIPLRMLYNKAGLPLKVHGVIR